MLFHKFFLQSSFVFDLFLENKTYLPYTKTILNVINSERFVKNEQITIKKKTFLVTDIPDYIKVNTAKNSKFLNVKQYQGALVNLSDYESVEDYLKQQFSKRNYKNLFSKERKLYRNYKIKEKVFHGAISKEEFDFIFNVFYTMLKKRFEQKKVKNRYLKNWVKTKAGVYNNILSKKASLHVIFDELTPIAITLNYHKDNTTFSHIQVYDINYSKYNMGDLCMLNHLKWCFKNNITVFDMAIEVTPYKTKWCNHIYYFYSRIYYRKASLVSILVAQLIYFELRVLQLLRDKNVIGGIFSVDKVLYKLQRIC